MSWLAKLLIEPELAAFQHLELADIVFLYRFKFSASVADVASIPAFGFAVCLK